MLHYLYVVHSGVDEVLSFQLLSKGFSFRFFVSGNCESIVEEIELPADLSVFFFQEMVQQR